ncbi:aminotransferase class IV [Streptomyces pratensis]|uniref:aminotransferase class IV n=1 Tax=Streptomyces pratensis TaxID=1169025 RepID=UPI00301714E2
MPPASAEQWLVWRPDRGFAAPPAVGELVLVDSWLVEEGTVRGLDLHRARFFDGCRDQGLPAHALEAFWQDLVGELPREGAWFPRVELRRDEGLALWVRPAPERTATIRVLLWPHPDPRGTPHRKGPDLELLAGVRARAREAGADDALFTTPDGFVTESATASLLWWEGDALVRPDADKHLLPGVTSTLIERIAQQTGVPVRRGAARPEHLPDREVWLVNALHGIRPVTEWTGFDRPAAPARHAARWQRLLRETAEGLPQLSGPSAAMTAVHHS